MRRPARSPPACISVRPPKRMTMFSPRLFILARWPSLKPSPMATIRTMDAIPHAIPAMVRKVRSLLRRRLSKTCPASSDKYVIRLLENHLLAFGESLDNFGFGAVTDAGGDGDLAKSFFSGGVGDLRRGGLVFVVKNGAFGDGEDTFVFVEDDLGIGGHLRLQDVLFVGDRDADFERCNVVLFGAHGGNPGYVAFELLVFE